MMKSRTIRQIVPAQKVNMGGHLLDQPLPIQGLDQIDPFLLIHHWKEVMPGGKKQNEVGVGPHPHRGFSPVTFVFEGAVEHRDSRGNRAVVEAGGTQWMHAGMGLTHSERPSVEMAKEGGAMEFIQFWVNSPAAYKMEQPFYLPLSAEDTPVFQGDNYELAIVAGDFQGIKGPAKTYSPQLLMRGSAKAGAKVEIPIPENYNALLYVLDGGAQISGAAVLTKDMAQFNNDGTGILMEVKTPMKFIILSGEPIGEEVSSYGPFVMNTQTEILEALRDSQMGKMGVLVEEFGDSQA